MNTVSLVITVTRLIGEKLKITNYFLIFSNVLVKNCFRRVRVANELGEGRGHAAKFAMIVSVVTSLLIGIFFWALILAFHDKIALHFTLSEVILNAVEKLSVLVACNSPGVCLDEGLGL